MRSFICLSPQAGVGKTTTAVFLAYGLAQLGKKTLLLDYDPQANATRMLAGRKKFDTTLADLFIDEGQEYLFGKMLQPTQIDTLFFLPGNLDLIVVYKKLTEMVAYERSVEGMAGQKVGPCNALLQIQDRFFQELEHYDGDFEYIVIDPPPVLSSDSLLAAYSAMLIAQEIIIPIQRCLDPFSLDKLDPIKAWIVEMKEDYNHDIHILGLLKTFTDDRQQLRYTTELLLDKLFFKVNIPKDHTIMEADLREQSIFAYAPKSKGAIAYREFVKEVLLCRKVVST